MRKLLWETSGKNGPEQVQLVAAGVCVSWKLWMYIIEIRSSEIAKTSLAVSWFLSMLI